MVSAIRTALLGAFLLLLGAGDLRAHIPEKLLIDLEVGEDSWSATSEMDVKFAVVALMHHYLPPDSGEGWIENLNSGQFGLVRELTEKLYRERFQLKADAVALEMDFRFPDYERPPLQFGIGDNDEPVIRVEMKGSLPENHDELSVDWVGRWGPTLALMIRKPGEETGSVLLAGLNERVIVKNSAAVAGMEQRARLGLVGWVREGFLRMVIPGLHAFFVLGLILLAARGRFLVEQVACFILAHSITFWLVGLGALEIPLAIVAPFLAIGVAYIGVENLILRRPGAWRLGVVTGLGLIHGIGLGLAAREIPVPQQGYLLPLAGFHVGFELGLVILLLGAVLLAWPLSRRDRISPVRVLGSIAVSIVGVFQVCGQLV